MVLHITRIGHGFVKCQDYGSAGYGGHGAYWYGIPQRQHYKFNTILWLEINTVLNMTVDVARVNSNKQTLRNRCFLIKCDTFKLSVYSHFLYGFQNANHNVAY